MCKLTSGGLPPQSQLIQSLVLLLPVPNVLPNHRVVATDGRDEIPAVPELLPHKVALALPIHPCQMDRAFALDEAHDLGDTEYFGGINNIMYT